MATQIYDQAYIFLNGQLLAEATSVESSIENQDQDVMTLVKGFAGQTPSPKKRTTRCDNVQTVAGFEFDFEQKEIDSEVVELKVQLGGSGLSAVSNGFIRNVSISSGVGQTMTVSFEHHGEPAIFE
tara:strand:+ start:313 stop:690 length:378 start_codon:yes stop_codon:yes gene_type:complete